MVLLRKLKISKITNVNFTITEKSIIDYITLKLSNLYLEVREGNPYSTYYKNTDHEYVLEHNYNTNYLYVSYPNLWRILESNYYLKIDDIQLLLSYMMWDILKMRPNKIFSMYILP